MEKKLLPLPPLRKPPEESSIDYATSSTCEEEGDSDTMENVPYSLHVEESKVTVNNSFEFVVFGSFYHLNLDQMSLDPEIQSSKKLMAAPWRLGKSRVY